jgi:hypothetical protein
MVTCLGVCVFAPTTELLFYANLRQSPRTPIAVTAAPAPAPCTMSGRGEYRLVWKAIMLSEPPREVAKGCDTGYLEKQHREAQDEMSQPSEHNRRG